MTAPPAKRLRRPAPRPSDNDPPVQPPAKFAHLKGDALYEALVTDDDLWDLLRIAQEAGRSKHAVDKWLGKLRAVERGQRRPDDYTLIEPVRYFGINPAWHAGQVRAWMMRTGKMERDGRFRRQREGRARGLVERAPRPKQRTWLDDKAPKVMAEYQQLLAGSDQREPLTEKAARLELARRHEITERAVIRWLQRARDLAAGIRELPTEQND